jgi:tyrosine-specific transport protein
MNINNKTPSMIGGILLVIGNVIGVGVLALPIVTAQLGLPYALLTLLFFWLLMMLGAYYFLEANLALPSGANLISMSRSALGKCGVLIAWISNLIVMYAIISAYISGGGDLIKVNFHYIGISIPSWASVIIFLSIFGFIVSRGIHITDHANRLLMLIKTVVFVVILAGLSSHINISNFYLMPQHSLSASLLIIVLTSFGFATLIPSLRSYYQSDVKKIKTMIFWGTFIPFVCYTLWVTLIFSVLPYHGNHGLEQMSTSTHPVSDLQLSLSQSLHIAWITQATNIFSAICIITSFLANSISFTDFIADGIGQKNNKKTGFVYFIAYFPVLCAVLFYPKAFLMGLSISSTLAVVQSLILPGLIVWFLRYRKKGINVNYSVMGGKPLLLLLLVISMVLLVLSILK